jgi:hypothetical protein
MTRLRKFLSVCLWFFLSVCRSFFLSSFRSCKWMLKWRDCVSMFVCLFVCLFLPVFVYLHRKFWLGALFIIIIWFHIYIQFSALLLVRVLQSEISPAVFDLVYSIPKADQFLYECTTWMYGCKYIHEHIYACAWMHAPARAHTYTDTHRHTHTHTRTYTHMQTHDLELALTDVFFNGSSSILIYINIHIHTHMLVHSILVLWVT